MMKRKLFTKQGIVKTILLMLSVTTLVFSIVSGTFAWLVAETKPVVNTFTYGDINITLEESDTDDGDGDPYTNTYRMVPGHKISKDPTVTVEKDSEDCWLFVKIEKSGDPAKFDDFMEFTVADGWTPLKDVDGVYFRAVDNNKDDQEFPVLKDNQVKVKDTVTKEMFNNLTEMPTLSFTAYAVQRDGSITEIDSAEKAWAITQK
jgi:hypothetical protein